MKPPTIYIHIIALALGLLLPGTLLAQRGTITIPRGNSVTVPKGASICADTIYANGVGHGSLTLADPSCVCSGSVVIPIELLMFSAVLQDGAVFLSWTTATETHNYGFEVQRKTEQADWEALGFIEGNGTATKAHSYSFTDMLRDVTPKTSLLRYRLKHIDLDGRYEFSPVVEVRMDAALPRFALESFPSPCDKQLALHLTLGHAGTTSLRLYDLAGRVVMVIARDVHLLSGYHTLQVRTTLIPSGIYLLAAEADADSRAVKVLIRH